MLSGIGTTLVDILGADRVYYHPPSVLRDDRASAAQLVRGIHRVVSVVSRDVHTALRELAP